MIQKIEKNIINIALLYLTVPIVIFLLGFLNLAIGILTTIIIAFCCYRIFKNEANSLYIYRRRIYYYLIIFGIFFVWLFFSGIGSFSFQNGDFEVRNAVFNDLINFKWPIIYDFKTLDYNTKESLNLLDGAGFVYYFTYWLPSALVGKLFGKTFANIALFVWSLFGLFIVATLINHYCKKQTFWTIIFMICFSGMDFLYYCSYGLKGFILHTNHLESWCLGLQYSSNTTVLYWVFNQAIPCWVIVALLMNVKKATSAMFVGSLIFAYSPWATFGLIPLTLYFVVSNLEKTNIKKQLIKLFLSPEFLWICFELLIFGTFYLSASSETSSVNTRGPAWDFVNNTQFGVFFVQNYIPFIFCELYCYYVLLKKHYQKNILFWLNMITLLLIPFYRISYANDFCMRASLGPLFILCILAIKYFVDTFTPFNFKALQNCNSLKSKFKTLFATIKEQTWYKQKISLCIFAFCFFISLATPIHEIKRSIDDTILLNKDVYILEHAICSIGEPKTQNGLSICDSQFYAKNYKNTFFFKYLARH